MADEAAAISTASFEELRSNWPSEGARDLAPKLGGEVSELLKSGSLKDDSAIRLSVAFNKSGHSITHSTAHCGKNITDDHGNIYMVSPGEFHQLLHKRKGHPRHCKSQTEALGRKGILLMQGIASLGGATGEHIDLWDGKDTADVHDYWTEASNILLWEC